MPSESRRDLSPTRHLFLGMWLFVVAIGFVACSSGSSTFGVDGGTDAAQATSDGATPDSSVLSDDGSAANGMDAGLCISDSDCSSGMICLYRTYTVCHQTLGQCNDPYTNKICSGSTTACDCNGQTFEIPCVYHDNLPAQNASPRPVAYLGACEAGADAGDASPE